MVKICIFATLFGKALSGVCPLCMPTAYILETLFPLLPIKEEQSVSYWQKMGTKDHKTAAMRLACEQCS